jgi:hypothetical protein
MRRARLPLLLISVLASRPAGAQWQFSADLGASHLRRSDIPQSGAVTLGANVIGVGEHGWFRSSALGVLANSQQSTGQALLAGAIVGPSAHSVRGEIGGFVSGFGESGYSLTLSGEIMPRLQIGNSRRGGAVGFGLGESQHAGASVRITHGAGDAWLTLGEEQFASSLSYVKTSGTFVGIGSPTLGPSFYDLAGAWRHDGGGIGVGATVGRRIGAKHSASGTWGAADASFWMFPRTALVFSVGRTLDDPVRGVPQTTFMSVALRLTGQPHATIGRRRELAGARVSVQRVDASMRRFEIRGVRGTTVEVMGDFTDWMPVSLEAAGDVWRFERAVTPGLHRIALRIDGGEWIAPVNIPHATDDLGGVVGLITVP